MIEQEGLEIYIKEVREEGRTEAVAAEYKYWSAQVEQIQAVHTRKTAELQAQLQGVQAEGERRAAQHMEVIARYQQQTKELHDYKAECTRLKQAMSVSATSKAEYARLMQEIRDTNEELAKSASASDSRHEQDEQEHGNSLSESEKTYSVGGYSKEKSLVQQNQQQQNQMQVGNGHGNKHNFYPVSRDVSLTDEILRTESGSDKPHRQSRQQPNLNAHTIKHCQTLMHSYPHSQHKTYNHNMKHSDTTWDIIHHSNNRNTNYTLDPNAAYAQAVAAVAASKSTASSGSVLGPALLFSDKKKTHSHLQPTLGCYLPLNNTEPQTGNGATSSSSGRQTPNWGPSDLEEDKLREPVTTRVGVVKFSQMQMQMLASKEGTGTGTASASPSPSPSPSDDGTSAAGAGPGVLVYSPPTDIAC